MSHTLIHNEKESKYEYHSLALYRGAAEDALQHGMHLTETQVPEALAGKGLARALLEDVLQEIEKANKKAVSKCSYIVKYEEKHPEKSDLFTS